MKIALFNEGDKLRELYFDENNQDSIPTGAYIVKEFEEKIYYTKDILEIGKQKDLDLNTNDVIINMETKEILAQKDIYLNFTKVNGKVNFKYGDNIIVDYIYKVELLSQDKIKVIKYLPNKKINLLEIPKESQDDYPYFYSSPRYVKNLNETDVSLELPPEKDKKNTIGDMLKKLIPLGISIIIAVLMLKIRPRGIRGILMLVSTFVSASITVITLIQDRKEAKAHNAKRKQVYEGYLNEKRIELNELKTLEKEAYHYNAISQQEAIKDLEKNMSRMYERELGKEDFLDLRIGKVTIDATYKISNPSEKLKLEKEEFELQIIDVYEDYKQVENVSKIIDLEKRNTAFTLEENVYMKQIYNYMMQLIYSNSYHDVKMILIGNEIDEEYFNIFKYARHFYNDYTGVYNFVFKDEHKEQVLNPYLNLLRDRDNVKSQLHKPHLLFIITDYKLIRDHPIMEYLLKDKKQLGFSLLFLNQYEESLPHIIDTILEFRNSQTALLKMYDGKELNEEIILEEPNTNKEYLEKLIRKIGRFEHIQGVKSNVPSKLGFLEMFEVNSPKQLNIKSRWQKNKAYDSLAALVGKKTQTDYISLNLHEKAHGPHGLIAGTTGSGKSEVIQTYILSLALNYSPEEVGFLLIDYKGGGMANLFKNMPHHLGSITNLDGYQSMRALASIKSELKRRQQIFSDNEVNHIDGYQKLYEKKRVKEALPHLFLISDEFAELKAEQPEFMKELVSAARIGRSLGIHLILATQKPSGVVDDQIWSNSKFKLCLKVAEEADSKELLKTPDAAYITNPGRGYLKVGNNELYELFQSGYSGGDFNLEDDSNYNKEVIQVDNVGRQKVIVENDKQKASEITELDAVLQEIEVVYDESGYQEIKKPWLEPLKEHISIIYNYKTYNGKINLQVELGLVDIPDQQKQLKYELDLRVKKNILISGAQSMGKTTTLLSFITILATNNSPENIEFYVLDLGNGGLLMTKRLNHVSEYIRNYETDKISRLEKLLKEEISKRKILLENAYVTSIGDYNSANNNKLKYIFIIIDNYEGMAELGTSLNDIIPILLREGGALGIQFIISNQSPLSLRSNIDNQISEKIVLYTGDKHDVNAALGKSDYESQEIAGRGQVKIDKPEVVQIYEPLGEQYKQMSEIIETINKLHPKSNKGLPLMPEVIRFEERIMTNNKLYVGYDYENIQEEYITYDNTVIFGDPKRGKTNMVKIILEQLIKAKEKILIIDDMKKELISYALQETVTYADDEAKLMNELSSEEYSVIIMNRFEVIEYMDKKVQKAVFDKLAELYIRGTKFIVELSEALKASNKFTSYLKKAHNLICMQNMTKQRLIFTVDTTYRKDEHSLSQAYVSKDGILTKVKFEIVSSKLSNQQVDIKDVQERNIKKNEIMIGDKVVELKNMIVSGKKTEEIINNMISQIKEKEMKIDYINSNQFPKEFKNVNKIDDVKKYEIDDEIDRILIINNFDMNGLKINEKKEFFEKLYSKEKLKTILILDEKVTTTIPFIKEIIKSNYGILTCDINEQKILKIRDRKFKESENNMKYNSDYAYIIDGKEIEKIKL